MNSEENGVPVQPEAEAEPVGEASATVSPSRDGIRTLTLEQAHTGWTTVPRLPVNGDDEVFISPHGHHYRRAKSVEEADLIAPMKTPGLRPLFLARIDHWVSGEG